MPFKSQKQRAWMYSQEPEMAKKWEKHTPKNKKLPKYTPKKKKKSKKKSSYYNLIVKIAFLKRDKSTMKNIVGFENYTRELLSSLRNEFAEEIRESRPVKYDEVVMWLDADNKLHREDGPAIERSNGKNEFWIHGINID